MSVLKFAAAAFLAASVYSPASAATCTVAVAGALTPSDACYVGVASNDSAATLTSEMVFGVDDWEFLAKDNDLDGTDEGDASLLSVMGTTLSGTLTIAQSVFDTYGSVSVVLKGPNSKNSTPNTFVAYLVRSAELYTYVSPFTGRNGQVQDISHVSLYGGAVTPPTVPLPATLFLLAGAVGGFGALRRRKAAAV